LMATHARGTHPALSLPGRGSGSSGHFGGVPCHCPADVGGAEQPFLIHREFAQVTEVFDIQVRGERSDELGRFVEGVGEGVRCPGRNRDARACLNIDVLGPGGESELAPVTIKISSCL
jgi:hypothetical protein